MRILKISLILSTSAFFLVACAGSQPATNNATTASNAKPVNAPASPAATATAIPDELASARKIYADKCIRCHKEDGTGGISEIDGTKIKAPDFTSEKMKKESDAEFIKVIEKGYPEDGMPSFKGKIPDEDIKNLVKLIRKDFQKQ